ncbi:MAG: 5'-nucleotidase C-terminal domain-containing protein [Propionibacteriaceae bacterium]|jgi:2',3'-cyclic-nucleotide 2'-phosphodiesterase/3'-nucleotidase|nr:5'-nucleotidase C-terminal domain-containing protein [Propionibacteriaceae bacterium]
MRRLKKVGVVLIAAFMMVLSVSTVARAADPVETDSPISAPLASDTSAGVPQEGDTQTFQILFTSDTHGAFRDTSYSTTAPIPGGMSRVATVVKQLRDSFDGTTILLDNGDTIQGNGTSFFINNSTFPTYPTVEAFNVLGYDAVGVGNHEFNFGIPALRQAFSGFQGELLCDNVQDASGNLMEGFKPYMIKELPNGLRVAIIGMVTPNIMNWDGANLAAAGLTALNPADETAKIIAQLKAADAADVYVALNHMGDTREYSTPGSGAADVISANPDLDVFLGAHFHTITGAKDKQVDLGGVKFVENRDAGRSVGQVLITATYENGHWDVKNKTGSYDSSDVKTDVHSTADQAVDAQMNAAMEPAHTAALANANTVVGQLVGGPLVPEPQVPGEYQGYLQDTALVHLINDVMMHYTGAELSGTAALDAHANAQPGKLTRGSIASIYKFDNNTLYTLKMTGAQFKKWMEWSYSYFGDYTDKGVKNMGPAVDPATDISIPVGNGGMAGYNQDNFAGLNYEVDLTKPVGERVVNMTNSDGTPFDLTRTYTVAANNYRAGTHLTNPNSGIWAPGDELPTILARDVASDLTGEGMMGLIIDYLSTQVPNQTLTNEFTPNWRFVGFEFDPALRAALAQYVAEGKISTANPVNPSYDRRAVKIAEVRALMGETGQPTPSAPATPTATPSAAVPESSTGPKASTGGSATAPMSGWWCLAALGLGVGLAAIRRRNRV